MICADLREPDAILDHPEVRGLLDSGEPIGLLMTAVMMFVSDASDPWALVSRYVARSGRQLPVAVAHHRRLQAAGRGRRVPLRLRQATEHMYFRSKTEIERFFAGLEIVPPYEGAEPGVTYSGLWGPRT